jgi:hypothetical protein
MTVKNRTMTNKNHIEELAYLRTEVKRLPQKNIWPPITRCSTNIRSGSSCAT